MIHYLKSVLVLFLIVTLNDTSAQIKTGKIIGINLSDMVLKTPGLNSDPKTTLNIHFGGVFDIPLKSAFTFQTGVLFSAKGTDYALDTVEYSIAPVYIEIPATLVFNFGPETVRISLFAGPYFGYAIGGYKLETGDELRNINFGSGENNDMKPFDYGLSLGIGANIKGIQISINYEAGLSDLSPVNENESEMKNRVIRLSVATLRLPKRR